MTACLVRACIQVAAPPRQRGRAVKTRTRTTTRCSASIPTPPPRRSRSAYRKLAKQYHPDVNNSTDAADQFREITEAYDTLTDPDRRRRYDRLHGTCTGRTTSATATGRPGTPAPATAHAPETGPRTATAPRPPAGS